ncbi:hypothetical protein HYX16_06295 [Candidatus Woesearchaeota archaeon]|nr:hypothetical protein [Candidatus Woesearchaeota archaeon]
MGTLEDILIDTGCLFIPKLDKVAFKIQTNYRKCSNFFQGRKRRLGEVKAFNLQDLAQVLDIVQKNQEAVSNLNALFIDSTLSGEDGVYKTERLLERGLGSFLLNKFCINNKARESIFSCVSHEAFGNDKEEKEGEKHYFDFLKGKRYQSTGKSRSFVIPCYEAFIEFFYSLIGKKYQDKGKPRSFVFPEYEAFVEFTVKDPEKFVIDGRYILQNHNKP